MYILLNTYRVVKTNTRSHATIVAVFSFLQEFSSTALAKHFKTDLNLKENSETCWNLLEY
jgi:hypothetical protein